MRSARVLPLVFLLLVAVSAALAVSPVRRRLDVVRGTNEMTASDAAGDVPTGGGAHEVDCREEEEANEAEEDNAPPSLIEALPTKIVAETHHVMKKDCRQTARSVTVSNHNRVTRGGEALPPGTPPTAAASGDDDSDEESSEESSSADGGDRSGVDDPTQVTCKFTSQATRAEARIVQWQPNGTYYGTPEGQAVASFFRHPRGGFAQFEFSAPLPVQGAAVYLDGEQGVPFGSLWSIQYRRSCSKRLRKDRWRDAVPYTGPLQRGWNSFRWEAPGNFRCWRWLLLDARDSPAAFTEYRWYPHVPTVAERVAEVVSRLAQCTEEDWREAKILFPWKAVGPAPQYRRDCDGVVRVRGLVGFEKRELKRVSSLTNPPIMRLPASHSPGQWSAFVASTGRGTKRARGFKDALDVVRNPGWTGAVYVQTDGAVLAQVFDLDWISLDQVVFSANATGGDWSAAEPSDPFSPFFSTRLQYRADSNGQMMLRGAASTGKADAKNLEREADDPVRKDTGVTVLPPGARPMHPVACPALTGHVPAGPRAKSLWRRADKTVNEVVAGTVRVEGDGRVLPRQFGADFVSLDGVFWSAASIESSWRALQVVPPFKARNQVHARKDDDGNVYLRGWLTLPKSNEPNARFSEEPVPALVLPHGWRPARLTILAVSTGPGLPSTKPPHVFDAVLDKGFTGTLYVLPDGRVMPVNFDEGWVSLDCVRFTTTVNPSELKKQ